MNISYSVRYSGDRTKGYRKCTFRAHALRDKCTLVRTVAGIKQNKVIFPLIEL